MTGAADPGPSRPGVVVHLDDPEPAKHAGVVTNVANLLADLDDGSPVELVVHGPAYTSVLREAPEAGRIGDLLARGVIVAVCANTLRGTGTSEDQLLPGVTVVPAGVGELVRRQRDGWAYLRP